MTSIDAYSPTANAGLFRNRVSTQGTPTPEYTTEITRPTNDRTLIVRAASALISSRRGAEFDLRLQTTLADIATVATKTEWKDFFPLQGDGSALIGGPKDGARTTVAQTAVLTGGDSAVGTLSASAPRSPLFDPTSRPTSRQRGFSTRGLLAHLRVNIETVA